MATSDGPQWFLDLTEQQREKLQQKASEHGIDLLSQVWRCDEWWARKKPTTRRTRWPSRINNWLDNAIEFKRRREQKYDGLVQEEIPTGRIAPRGFQPSPSQVRERTAVGKV